MLRLLLLVLIGALVYWYLPGLQEAIEEDSATQAVTNSRRIQLQEVVLTAFAPDGSLRHRITGDEAELGLKGGEDAWVRPAVVEVYRQGQVDTRITGRIGRKRKSSEGPELFEVEGDVVGTTSDGKQIVGERVHYFLDDQRVVTPVRASVIASDTQVSGDVLEMETRMDQGRARGDVEITHWEAAGAGGTRPEKLVIHGSEANFDFRGRHHRVDHQVVATRATMRLTCEHLELYQEAEKLIATKQVRIEDEEVRIECDRLDYKLPERTALAVGTASELPHLYYRHRDPAGEASDDIQELRARKILASFQEGEKWLQGDQEVRFEIYTLDRAGRRGEPTVITSREVDAFYETGRATFAGDVHILSARGGARGQRAVYYRESGRIYVSGEAEAWEQGPRDQEVRRIRGELIRYDLESGSATVLGGVRGYLPEGQGG